MAGPFLFGQAENQVNLLTNSGFGVWSNSEDLYTTAGDAVGDSTVEDATDLIDNGNMGSWQGGDPDLPVGWSNKDADAGEISDGGGYMHLDVSADGEGCDTNTFTTVAGKLYEFTASFTRTGGTLRVFIKDGDGSGTAYDINLTATDTTYSVVFESAGAGAGGFVRFIAVGGAAEWAIDKVQLHEVTPGIVSAAATGPDGWHKDTTLDIWRQHNDGGTVTKDGSFYALKMTPGAADDFLIWPLSVVRTQANHYQKYAGRTVTFGAWVKAGAASSIFLQIIDSDTTDYDQSSDASSYGANGTWTWLEVTATISATTTEFSVAIVADTTDTAYISQPMLVFGSSIGEGNYVQPPGEIVWCETNISDLTIANASGYSDITATVINLEATTEGKIPKGAVSVAFYGQINDSGSAGHAYESRLELSPATTMIAAGYISSAGLVNDARAANQGSVSCNSAGDIAYKIRATGSETFDIIQFYWMAVQVAS